MRKIVLVAGIVLALMSCLSTREKMDAYVFEAPAVLTSAWLRNVEIVADSLPLSEEYSLVSESLVAMASRQGLKLSTTCEDQPYVVDLVIHERSFAMDLSTSYSVMAMLNVASSADANKRVACVVYSATTPESILSLFRVGQVCQKILESLQKELSVRAKNSAEHDVSNAGAISTS